MDESARDMLAVVRRCIACGHYRVLGHFTQRMDQRGLFCPDVVAAIERATDALDKGLDDYDRPKWLIIGQATDGSPMGIILALDTDDRGDVTVFITAYWDEG